MTAAAAAALKVVTNRWFLIALLVVGVILTIYFSGKRAGKATLDKFVARPLPNSGGGIPQNWDATASALVDELYDAIFSWTAPVEKKARVIGKFLPLTDDQLTACYNLYNARYGLKNGETLTEAIDGELMPFYDEDDQLIARLRQLNLR